jgi:hypothetical protein
MTASRAKSEHEGKNLQEPAKYGETSSLYPRRSARARATLTRRPSAGPRLLAKAAFKVVTVIGFKGIQAGVEQFPLRHDHDVEAWGHMVSTENLPNQSFRSIPLDGATESSRGGNPQASDRQLVRQEEKGAETAADPDASFINLLKFGTSTDVLVGAESHQWRSALQRLPSAACALFRADSCQPTRLFTTNREPLAPFGPAALEHEPPVLGAHAHQESVRPPAVARVRLKRTLTLHDLPREPF